jgi:signal transduction histidine kinase
VAIVIPVFYMTVGLFVVDLSTHQSLISLAQTFLPSVVVLALAIMLGDAVRSRRALAAETADRLRLAEEEREAEAARRVAEERLRIARELHDTVAHGMATITVQAGSALHVRGTGDPDRLRAALVAIRETSKGALADMRVTLGQLRGDGADVDGDETRAAGLDRLAALSAAVRAAGAPVTVTIEGEQVPLPSDVDHAAYRILQESLTNVLRHAGTAASATVCLGFARGELAIRVTDDGNAEPAPDGQAGPGAGHEITGMAERAAAVGGHLSAGPRPGGGFEVVARLPVTLADAPDREAADRGAAEHRAAEHRAAEHETAEHRAAS